MRHTHTCKHCQREWTCMREDCDVFRDGRTYEVRCNGCDPVGPIMFAAAITVAIWAGFVLLCMS